MPFEKGKSGNPKGKKPGQQNKATLEFKEAVNKLLDFATPQMVGWLEEVAQENPEKALDHVYKFAQFAYPLLARQTLSGDPENPIVYKKIEDILADIDGQTSGLPEDN